MQFAEKMRRQAKIIRLIILLICDKNFLICVIIFASCNCVKIKCCFKAIFCCFSKAKCRKKRYFEA